MERALDFDNAIRGAARGREWIPRLESTHSGHCRPHICAEFLFKWEQSSGTATLGAGVIALVTVVAYAQAHRS